MLPLRGVVLYVSVYYPRRCPWVDDMLPLRGVFRGLMYVALPRALPVG